jgi:hypothetical protein
MKYNEPTPHAGIFFFFFLVCSISQAAPNERRREALSSDWPAEVSPESSKGASPTKRNKELLGEAALLEMT